MSTESAAARPLEVGAEVAGFRIERVIGRGRRSVVYEATQVSLDRRVALKLVRPDPGHADRFRRLVWPEHPCVVSLFAAGIRAQGAFVAMQLVRGPSLADLRQDGPLEPARALEILGDVASALDAAHSAGIAHGAVEAKQVLIDHSGRALMSGFESRGEEATLDGDLRDFAALARQCLGDRPTALEEPPPATAADVVRRAERVLRPPVMPHTATLPRGRRGWIALAGAAALGAAALATFIAGDEREPAPPVPRSAVALGSSLAPGGIESVDCEGQVATGGSQTCTLVQTRLPGRELVPARAGAIRRWAVSGARGELALQVLRRSGDEFALMARSPFERVADDEVHRFATNLPVRAGDLVGLEVAPGAAIGVRKGVRGAATARWFGPLVLTPRPVERDSGTGLDYEVLLRVDYVPGAKGGASGRLTGRAARLAAPGRTLGSREVDLPGPSVRTVAVVRLRDRVFLDLLADRRRLVRIAVEDVDPRGRLLNLTAVYGRVPRAVWRDPDGRVIRRDYAVGPRSLDPRG